MKSTVAQFAKFEAAFTLPNPTGNPFDPAVNDIDAVITGPHGLRAVVPAFWDGDRWRVRYAPTVIGEYRLSITRNGAAAQPIGLSASRFRGVASKDLGFIRVNPKIAQKFAFDGAQPYYPIGINVAWRNGGDPAYPVYFAQMEKAHLNWARVWMNNWDGKNLEWAADSVKNPKIGEYLLDVARHWDEIVDSAAQHGVYLQMTLQHHGQYTEKTDPNWSSNPFNAANGGFLKKPDDFFTDPEARRLTKAKYRYIVARWGYSDHILAFELFNEVQNIGEADSHFQDVIDWHKEMAAYLRSLDVNHHLLTTSYSDPGNPLSKIGLDYDQIHSYPPDVVSTFAALRTKGLKTPVFFGEWGPPDVRPEDLPGLVHDGLWAGLTAPTAGAQQYWYWDRVASRNFWPVFASAGAFVQAFGVPSLAPMDPVEVTIDAPGPKGDLSFAPPGGWEATTKTDVTLTASGTPDLSGISSYIQGQGHREMMPHPIVFHVNSSAPFQFRVLIGSVGKGGAHPTLSLDGASPQELSFPAADREHNVDQVLSVDVPSGAHTLSLFNTGDDWFVAKRIIATAYAPGVAVMAKGNAASSLFWAYDRDRAGKTPRTATLHFSGLEPGRYQVRLWDVAEGKPGSVVMARVSQSGALAVALPNFVGDIAGVVSKP
ncbi:hypothetical protein CCAX7_36710 [Capsulimonas corticalis]|uniref:Uncharacterized protein n=1 Tax=Capsulimonas corticalis TaxID=2219043 RepID=A0A402D1G4_9BACT|nr:DUF5060 domain-containing protein [Capsulimonas corticalis]BDI31620.1 hypothetical protein CCAX7_36710 [Capsulimonas corticalis]